MRQRYREVPWRAAGARLPERNSQPNQAADKFGKCHVRVVSFDEVTNPAEIAEDLVTLVA